MYYPRVIKIVFGVGRSMKRTHRVLVMPTTESLKNAVLTMNNAAILIPAIRSKRLVWRAGMCGRVP